MNSGGVQWVLSRDISNNMVLLIPFLNSFTKFESLPKKCRYLWFTALYDSSLANIIERLEEVNNNEQTFEKLMKMIQEFVRVRGGY